jgi:phosphate-selective porin OprO/OprP
MGPFWLGGEGLINSLSAPDLGDPVFHGYHVMGSWSLTGEMRTYNKRSGVFNSLPVARPITEGGRGAFELAMRWSSLDLSDAKVCSGELDTLSIGLNWWPVRVVALSTNYRHIILDRRDTRGKSDGILIRLLLMLD